MGTYQVVIINVDIIYKASDNHGGGYRQLLGNPLFVHLRLPIHLQADSPPVFGDDSSVPLTTIDNFGGDIFLYLSTIICPIHYHRAFQNLSSYILRVVGIAQ